MKRILLLVLVLSVALGGYAQKNSKLSAGTRLVLSQYNYDKVNKLDKRTVKAPRFGGVTLPVLQEEESEFVKPFKLDGVDVLDCFVVFTDNNYSSLRSIPGVKVRAEFDKMVTAYIPVDVLDKVEALANVKKVEVATKETIQTDDARICNNVDDILNFSADAKSAGLTQAYDGTGVIVGVIDQGIQYNHTWFKDAGGNSRVKKAFLYDSSGNMQSYTGDAIAALTTDTTSTSHGSHTSGIAAGSDYTFSGTYYNTQTSSVVTGTRKYGGMAPGADLVLFGLGHYTSTTNTAAAAKAIFDYADEVGKPCVINYSLGNASGSHDGTGALATALAPYADQPGRAFVVATSNNAYAYHHGGTSTSMSPDRTIISFDQFGHLTDSSSNLFVNYLHSGTIVGYPRNNSTSVDYAIDLAVVNLNTNETIYEWQNIDSDVILSCNPLDDTSVVDYDEDFAKMFAPYDNTVAGEGQVRIHFDTDAYSGKKYFTLQAYRLTPISSSSYVTQSGTTYTGVLYFAISVHPKNLDENLGFDLWGTVPSPGSTTTVNGTKYNAWTTFKSATTTYTGDSSIYAYTGADNNCTASTSATIPSVISVGSYVSKKSFVYEGRTAATNYSVTLGTIASTSSYQTADSPTGVALPTILAPGYGVISAGNAYAPSSMASNRIIVSGDNPIYINTGTSMAAPNVTGTIALWFQANPELTSSKIKQVLAASAATDSYTGVAQAGPNGKLDALAGLAIILNDKPAINASVTELKFTPASAGTTTQTFTVTGQNLSGDVTATLIDPDGYFGIDKVTLSKSDVENAGVVVTVSYTITDPTTITKALIRITAAGCDPIDVELSGGKQEAGEGDGPDASSSYLDMSRYATTDDAGWNSTMIANGYVKTDDDSWDYYWVSFGAYGLWYNAGNRSAANATQKWIYNVTATNQAYGSTTSAVTYTYSSPFQGRDAYRQSGKSFGFYGGSANSYIAAQKYYVTNVEEVSILTCLNSTYISTSLPTFLRVYECTSNGTSTTPTEGSLVGEDVKTSRVTGTTNTTPLTVSGLDPEKIYCVYASVNRGCYLYEVAFKVPKSGSTPAPKLTSSNVSSGQVKLSTKTGVAVNTTVNITGKNVVNNITLTLNDDDNVFSIDRTVITPDEAMYNVSSVGGEARQVKASASGQDVTVTLSTNSEGSYEGLLYATTPGAMPLAISLVGDVEYDPATGIDGIATDENGGKEVWYTLQGIRLTKAPTTKGVYIRNGKKVLVK